MIIGKYLEGLIEISTKPWMLSKPVKEMGQEYSFIRYSALGSMSDAEQ